MIDENRDEILMENTEDLAIMNRYRLLVNKLVETKADKNLFVSKQFADVLDTPETTCEYTEEQYAKVLELKEELFSLAHALGYSVEQANILIQSE